MKTAYEKSMQLGDEERKKDAQGFIERLRRGYTQLDSHRKELKQAKQNKEGKSRYIDLKKEIKQTKVAITQIRDEFNQWMNGLPTAA